MKKLAIFAAALMLTLGLAQCKKEQPLTPESETKIIHITVNVGGGSKHVVVPGEGTVTFADGDVLYVGDGSHYIGTLTCADGAFSGDIIEPTGENPQMHLYFVGGLTPSATPVEGTTENFTVNLSNQSSKLPVLSYTSVAYTGEHAYSCTLENKCALVKFSGESLTNESVTLTGVYNTATIDFANGAITPVETTGNITLYPDPNNQQFRWAILLPQTGVSATANIDGCIYAIDGLPENITNNYYNGNTLSGVSIGLSEPIFNPHTSALTFEAKTNNVRITLSMYKMEASLGYAIIRNGSSAPVSWEAVDQSECTVTLDNVGDKVSFRAYYYDEGEGEYPWTNYRINDLNFSSFEGDEFYVYGNIMSLIYSEASTYSTATSFPWESSSFEGLFKNNTGLYSHPEKALLLPATSLNNNCYASMFKGCTHLTTAPELPATSLATGCYQSMFEGCTNLVSVPASLPVTSLPAECYQSMFKNCTALTTAPALPAMSLAEYCYESMFEGCTNLMAAPELPATVLADYCYRHMFYGCTNLNSVKCLATDISADGCTTGWLNGVASTGIFTTPSTTNWSTGGSGIPSGWTRKNPDGTPYVTETTITWNSSYIGSSILHDNAADDEEYTQGGITLALPGGGGSSFMDHALYIEEEYAITFTSTVGNISKIEISYDDFVNLPEGQDWSFDGSTVTWEGTPASSVTLSAISETIVIIGISQIVFTVQ